MKYYRSTVKTGYEYEQSHINTTDINKIEETRREILPNNGNDKKDKVHNICTLKASLNPVVSSCANILASVGSHGCAKRNKWLLNNRLYSPNNSECCGEYCTVAVYDSLKHNQRECNHRTLQSNRNSKP